MHEKIQAIEERRRALGVSQSELTRRADVHATTYFLLLKGRSSRPQMRTISRLRRALTAMEAEAGR